MEKHICKKTERCGRLKRFEAAVVGASMTGSALFILLFKTYHNEKNSCNP